MKKGEQTRQRMMEAAEELFCSKGFEETSVQDRYRILLESMVLERDYSCTSLILSRRPPKTGAADYSEPFASLGFLRFCKSFFAHLAAHAED